MAANDTITIHYVEGFFGPMKATMFSKCEIPCARSASPGEGRSSADVLVSFPIAEVPPSNDHGALAVAHSMESMANGYGSQYIGGYKYTATTSLNSTVPWLYF